jgi:predicted enzyme related to lactoylglutathione lyase
MTGKTTANERKVTGIGGVFFKCKDPGKVREWYQKHLGLKTNQYGAVFEWKQAMDSTKKGFTQWSPFSEKSKYFDKEFMINYRVVNLTALIEELRKNGVTIADSVVSDEFGKFVHIVDIEGNKVELWEPNDVAYDNFGKQNRMPTTK